MFSKYKILFLVLLLGITGCKKELPQPKINTFLKEVIASDDRKVITPEEAKTYHIDTKRKYEYRTGNPGEYKYNYDVKGISINGDSVFGNINTKGKFGAGILISDTIADVEIKTEWISYGKLKATDNQGNEFYLIVK
ncbi:hypothetical protein [Flavobacterium reichenbachii]|uniref:Lipoprotein n=1 Tax=Flavobacterium reichenbachii TaxID=362418 RepID=A0A085ZIF0_9FLAO|nr:hypothetical protein [Flavobacterium reichenbachii]KFF04214.1 hypothetical protein IW19_01155 [Flavobacterium reichenbachii]OXB13886.1 hypothetical protein B0A68_14150 [Flavobacterium reichenbachii]